MILDSSPVPHNHYLFCVCTHCLHYQILMQWSLRRSQLERNRVKAVSFTSTNVRWGRVLWRENSGFVVKPEMLRGPRRMIPLNVALFSCRISQKLIAQAWKRGRPQNAYLNSPSWKLLALVLIESVWSSGYRRRLDDHVTVARRDGWGVCRSSALYRA